MDAAAPASTLTPPPFPDPSNFTDLLSGAFSMSCYNLPMTNVLAFPEKLCRVLVIDADPATAVSVRDALSKVSPRVRVYNAPDLGSAVPRLSRDTWDLVVLKPWQAKPGKPLPISIIRKAGYDGPVVPVTLGGQAIRRLPKGAKRPIHAAPKPILQHQNKAARTAASRRPTVPALISQLLDESYAAS